MNYPDSRRRASIFVLFAAISAVLVPTFVQAQTATLNTLMYFNGSTAVGGLTLGLDGALYGVGSETSFSGGAVGGLVYRLSTDAGQLNTIYQYGRLGDYTGGGPRGRLARDASGNLYGVTAYTRIDSTGRAGSGTVFKIDPKDGNYTRLRAFDDTTNTPIPRINVDGIGPMASLLLTDDGFLYGTTVTGGANGTGTIFKIATDGTGFAVLHHFGATAIANGDHHPINDDGVNSVANDYVFVDVSLFQGRLALATNGDLYGTANSGGPNGTGVIYRLHRDGTGFTVLKSFDASPPVDTTTNAPQTNFSGAYPSSGLLDAGNGYLYGTTQAEGDKGFGNIYRILPDGNDFAVMKSFNLTDGSAPFGELIVAQDGTIVGTTLGGGVQSDTAMTPGAGTIYSMSLDGGTFERKYVFGTDGGTPQVGVIQASDGSFYGATSQLGPYNQGTVFRFSENNPTNPPAPQGTPQAPRTGAIAWWLLIALLILAFAARRMKKECRS